jgi:hypothetical protein
MEADFGGYATKAGLRCTDGRTITAEAFQHMDGETVPLVWHHGGDKEPRNVLGHAVLEARPDGIYAYGYFNDTETAKNAKALVKHSDIKNLSIYANQLVEKGKTVIHGAIREVSLVLAGANPGALIDYVSIVHSDGEYEIVDDAAVIHTGLDIEHADDDSEDTIGDVYETLSTKQKELVNYMIGMAILDAKESIKQSAIDGSNDTEAGDAASSNTEGTKMVHNIFEQGDKTPNKHVLSHSDIKSIVESAEKTGSMKAAVEDYAFKHGITNIDLLFPEAQSLTTAPEWDKRRTEWVSGVLDGARKSPFSRIKTWTADITYDEARARGYIKGDFKKEEFFSVAKRVTTPQTIYKKQAIDRDDMIDITDFDVVAWMKGEMRLMLDEEIARAVLIGDGREIDDSDKINPGNIRPIAFDDPYYTVTVGVNLGDSNSSIREVLDTLVLNREFYKGTGSPTFYTTENFIAQCLILRDLDGKRMYRSVDDIAAEMRVSGIVAVEVLESEPNIIGIMVNMADYVIGADKGGSVSMFEDFDIDYNKHKYLIETRISGALVKPKSAIVVLKTGSSDVAVVPTKPGWNPATHTVTIPTVTGVSYLDGDGKVLAGGSSIVLTSGQTLRVNALEKNGYYFATGRTTWSFMRS